MGDTGQIPPLPDFPPTSFADQTPPPATISVPETEPDRPTQAFAFPQNTLDQLYKWVYWFQRDRNAPPAHSHTTAGEVVGHAIESFVTQGWFANFLNGVLNLIGPIIFDSLDALRKGLDPSFGRLAVDVLNELMGGDLTPDMLPVGTDVNSHIQRAEIIGGLLFQQLETEFGGAQPVTAESGQAAAEKFTGFAINFGVANGIIATLGGLVPFIHLDEIREIGENVAKNIGLGRLVRLALQPLVRTLVQTPYQWALNQKYHPSQFDKGDLINPFTGAVMDHGHLYKAMDLLGYTTDKIDALVALHAKKLATAELATLTRYHSMTDTDAITYLTKLGYSSDDAARVLLANDASKADAWVTKLVDAILAEYVAGNIPPAELTTVLDSVFITGPEQQVILALATYMQQKHVGKPHHVPPGEMLFAYENGLIDLGELEDYYSQLGYDDNSVTLLTQIALLKNQQLADKAKAKAARQAAAAAKAAAKANPPATPA